MKVKEITRTANVAWSPSAMQNIYMACGTVAQQLDATFSTSAKLEVFSLDLGTPGLDMPLLGAVESPQRFHKVVWSGLGLTDATPNGLIIGGSDNGTITIWNAEKVIESSSEALVNQTTQHVGAVRALDVNPFQPNLLASGAGESEIFIWDLNSPTTAMSPGNKILPLEDISGVAWNRQVQHILGSTSPCGRSVVWDLRKNEPIIQVADSSSKMRCSGIAWHPDVATQLVTSSGEDRAPIIQMWDLRFATAPVKTLEHHKKGILSIAWCPQDSDLLLSASKDNQVLCWNPNSDVPGGEVVYELPATSQWIFECHWCPRNPAIISTASFDGHVSMYSLLGGGGTTPTEPVKQQSPIASDDPFANLGATAQSQQTKVTSSPLKTPPKWFRRPCGASFGFGGKLVSFGNTRGAATPKTVHMSQVVTEHDFLQRSNQLEESLSRQQFMEFCERKIQNSSGQEKDIWNFLKVTFDPEPRRQYLKLLGYDTDELAKKFATWTKMSVSTLPSAGGLDVNELSQKLSTIPAVQEEGVVPEGAESTNFREEESDETSSTAAVFGSEGDGRSVFDAISTEPSARTSKRVSNASFMGLPSTPPSSLMPIYSIPTDTDTDGLLSQALLVGDFEAAVDICVSADRMAEALILAVAGGSDLLQRTQQVFFQKKQNKVTKLMSSVINHNWTDIARYGSLDNWKEVLAALVTYAGPEDFAQLCDLLGQRLETEFDGRYRDNASLCYICSGNVEKFVECWNSTADSSTNGPTATNGSALVLQDLIEKVVLLRKAVEKERKQFDTASSNALNEKLRLYSNLLASQGSLGTALSYLQQGIGNNKTGVLLHDRLYQAQSCTSSPRPEFPFDLVNINPPQAPEPVQPPQTQQQRPHQTAGLTRDAGSAAQPSSGSLGTGIQAGQGVGISGGGGSSSVYARAVPATTIGGGVTGSTQHIMSTGNITATVPGGYGSGVGGVLQTTVTTAQPDGTRIGIFNPALAKPDVGVVTSTVAPPPPKDNNGLYNTDTISSWNDPPTLKTKKTSLSSTTPMAPIMAPVMTPVQPRQDIQQPLPHAIPSVQDSQTQAVPSPVQKKAPSPAPVVQKAPIPQEHMPMVEAFNGMLERCKAAATTTVVRRKLDDITKKLSLLYDLLRESRLSMDVLQGLHYIAQDAQTMNYQGALARYNHMVGSGNFSEISSFMPGIKALFQLGIQLRV